VLGSRVAHGSISGTIKIERAEGASAPGLRNVEPSMGQVKFIFAEQKEKLVSKN
jgi:hypothetical protein